MAATEEEWMDEEGILFKEPDECDFCHGFNGGVLGNENRIGGYVVCDYCHVIHNNILKNIEIDMINLKLAKQSAKPIPSHGVTHHKP